MPEPLKKSSRYMPGLDGLRAVAVGAVIAYHLGVGWAPGGLLGVGVFFTLSGYLITDLLLGAWHKGSLGLGDFWIRRARRLLPAVLQSAAREFEFPGAEVSAFVAWHAASDDICGARSVGTNCAAEID